MRLGTVRASFERSRWHRCARFHGHIYYILNSKRVSLLVRSSYKSRYHLASQVVLFGVRVQETPGVCGVEGEQSGQSDASYITINVIIQQK